MTPRGEATVGVESTIAGAAERLDYLRGECASAAQLGQGQGREEGEGRGREGQEWRGEGGGQDGKEG